MDVEPLGGTIGATIHGLDSTTLGEDDYRALAGLLAEYRVIFLRDQEVAPAVVTNFAEGFGQLRTITSTGEGKPVTPEFAGYPAVSTLHGPLRANEWHCDQTFMDPNLFTVLQCLNAAEAGGATTWSNTTAAFYSLSEKLQDYLTDLWALHTSRSLGDPKEEAVHPVVRRRHATGEPALYVNRMFTERIVGVGRREDRWILGLLFDLLEQPHFSCTWYWRAGDIGIWDNTATVHVGSDDYAADSARRMFHVGIIGDTPEPYRADLDKVTDLVSRRP